MKHFTSNLKRELEPLWNLHCMASVITYLSADDRLNFASTKSTGLFVVVVVVVDFTKAISPETSSTQCLLSEVFSKFIYFVLLSNYLCISW